MVPPIRRCTTLTQVDNEPLRRHEQRNPQPTQIKPAAENLRKKTKQLGDYAKRSLFVSQLIPSSVSDDP